MSEDFVIPLPNSRGNVTFTLPRPLTEGEWSYLVAVLQAMRPGLVTA